MENSELKTFSSNLKKLMAEKGMNQKQFAEIMGISESTLSGYMKSLKQPSFSFLTSLKDHFSGILLDDILFNNNLELHNDLMDCEPDRISDTEYLKYKGSYALYYLDTGKKPNSKLISESVHEPIDLKFGILYVSATPVSKNASAVKCIAIFGLKTDEELQSIKDEIDSLYDDMEIFDLLKCKRPHGLYLGQFHMSQMHIFVTLNKAIDAKDQALIILHHASINKDFYSGGIGTINSVSTGRSSEPIVQLIALSKKRVYISYEQIKLRLQFSTPDIRVKGQQEAAEILKLAKTIYRGSDSSSKSNNPYEQFNEHNIEILLTSYMEYLISKNLENHQLWCGRVSSGDDDAWYHLLKEAETYHEKRQKDADHGIAEFETELDYPVY